MAKVDTNPAGECPDHTTLIELMRRRRSVRQFQAGQHVSRKTLLGIAEAARWAPTGANAQCWDLVIVDEPAARDAVIEIFVEQSKRLFVNAKGFPAVSKSYLSNTVAIFMVLGDPRWKVAFPQQDDDADGVDEYTSNNENIYFCSLGAVIQNIQLAVTDAGLTSAWLSGGGEASTNRALSELLGYPEGLSACGTIPVGYPKKDVRLRYRRPLEQLVHFNGYTATQFRPQGMLDYYLERLRPFLMYRNAERVEEWDDAEDKCGEWLAAFTGAEPNPSGRFD